MTAYDVRGQALASRMLAPISKGGKGQVVTLSTPFPGVLDKATETRTTGAPTTQTASGVALDYSQASIAQGLVLAGDKKLLLSPTDEDGQPITAPTPDVTTVILADASKWLVKRSQPLSPAGLVVMYELQLRGVK